MIWREAIEQTALRVLAEAKPGRNLRTNVEFYTALVLQALGSGAGAIRGDVCVRTRGRLVRARDRAARRRSFDSSAIGIYRADWIEDGSLRSFLSWHTPFLIHKKMPHEEKLEQLRRMNAEAEAGGGAERREREHKAGKLTARERVELLLDEGTFEELDKFVRHRSTDFGMDEQRPAGDGFVTGYGRIEREAGLRFRAGFHGFRRIAF